MKIVTLDLIGQSLGITKQAVSKEFIKKGLIVKNDKGKIDIEEKQNRAFLKSKGADFSVFYPKDRFLPPKKQKPKKKTVKATKKEEKEEKEEVVEIEINSQEKPKTKEKRKESFNISDAVKDTSEMNLGENKSQKLDLATRLERYKGIQKDNELKELKIMEEEKRLLDRRLVETIVFDIFKSFNKKINQTPESIVDNLFSIVLSQDDNAREQAIQLMRNSLVDDIEHEFREMKKNFDAKLKKLEV